MACYKLENGKVPGEAEIPEIKGLKKLLWVGLPNFEGELDCDLILKGVLSIKREYYTIKLNYHFIYLPSLNYLER